MCVSISDCHMSAKLWSAYFWKSLHPWHGFRQATLYGSQSSPLSSRRSAAGIKQYSPFTCHNNNVYASWVFNISPLGGIPVYHDDVTKWKHFLRYYLIVRKTIGQWWIPLTKASDVELWCFLWFAPEQKIRQTIKTPVSWGATPLIMM